MRLAGTELAVERGGRLVFSGLGFALESGAALLLTGANGAGKSTLLRLIAGLLPPSAGALSLDGGDAELSIGQHCHYFGHQDALKTALTVAENLQFWRDFYASPRLGVAQALDAVGLAPLADLPAGYLSAGQRRRLSLGRLLVSHRPIWLMDEPTSALDAASEARFIALTEAHLGQGGLVVAATHQPLPLSRAAILPIRQDNRPAEIAP